MGVVGRFVSEGTWIPVSAHGNDGGGNGMGVVGRSVSEGTWIPVSGHGNDGVGAGWA